MLLVLQMPVSSPAGGFRRVCFVIELVVPEAFYGNASVAVYKPLAALTDSYLMSLTHVFTQSPVFQSIILKACLHADLSRFAVLALLVHFPTA